MKGNGSEQKRRTAAKAADSRVKVDVLHRAGFPAQRDVCIYQQRAGVLHAADHEAGLVPAAGARGSDLRQRVSRASRDSAARFADSAALHALSRLRGTRAATRSTRRRRLRTPPRAPSPARPPKGQSRRGWRSRGAAPQHCRLQRCGFARARSAAQPAALRASAAPRPVSINASQLLLLVPLCAYTKLTRLSHAALAHALGTGGVAAVPIVPGGRARALARTCASLLIAARGAACGRRAVRTTAGVATAGSRGCTQLQLFTPALPHAMTALPPDSFSLASSASASSFFRPFLITAGALSTCGRAIGAR